MTCGNIYLSLLYILSCTNSAAPATCHYPTPTYSTPTSAPAHHFISLHSPQIIYPSYTCKRLSAFFPLFCLWVVLMGLNLVYWAITLWGKMYFIPSIFSFSSNYLGSSHCDHKSSRVFQASLSSKMFSYSCRQGQMRWVIFPSTSWFILWVSSNLHFNQMRKVGLLQVWRRIQNCKFGLSQSGNTRVRSESTLQLFCKCISKM